MDWTAVGALAEMTGAIGVIASLIYVGRQVQFASKSAVHRPHRS